MVDFSMMSYISIRKGIFVIEFFGIIMMLITWTNIPSPRIQLLDVSRYISNQTIANIASGIEDSQLHPCIIESSVLKGRNNISRENLKYTNLLELFPDVHNGFIKPDDCKADQKIAIIIPFRNRQSHLNIWLKNVIPFFKRQQRDVTIFVSEQAGNQSFNRGMIRNVGFREAAKYGNFDCFIFNDVDVIPEDDRNIYHCTDTPNHMSGKIDRHQYRHMYKALVGGILAFKKNVFEEINGYSNRFFMWGGEDDNLNKRMKVAGYRAQRPLFPFSHTSTLRHARSAKLRKRQKILTDANLHVLTQDDGLSNLKYQLLSVRDMKLYIRITSIIKNQYF